MELDSYLELVSGRLTADGFKVQNDYNLPGYVVQVVAYHDSFSLSSIVTASRKIVTACLSYFENPNPGNLKGFADAAFSLTPGLLGGERYTGYYVFPVVVSRNFTGPMVSAVGEFKTVHKLDRFNHPVLAALNDEVLYQRDNRPIWGAASYGFLKKTVEKYFSFVP